MRILIAEDDRNLGQGIVDLLTLEGFQPHLVQNGPAALDELQRRAFDFCILDVMIPGMDGFTLCRKIRDGFPHIPLLFLTARGEEYERVLGFDCGADDYVVKPFGTNELVARIRAIAKRSARNASDHDTADRNGGERWTMADLTIDPSALRAFRNGQYVDLQPREMQVLRLLFERAGKAVSRDDLFDHCWGRDYMPNSRSLDQYVSALRHKIEQDPANPVIIRTVHGVGYRYDPA